MKEWPRLSDKGLSDQYHVMTLSTKVPCRYNAIVYMVPLFWDQRYAENETVYGQEPNHFFKQFIDKRKPGSILLPAEGEGRNAVYAASKGWKVDAFDFSAVARDKALALAETKGVQVHYDLMAIDQFKAGKQYDVVALIYVHMPPDQRVQFHQEILKAIKPGGFLLMEAFSKEQLELESGGPRDAAMLYDAPSLCKDSQSLHMMTCHQKDLELNEGPFHKGPANVLRLTGQKI
jgi:SAM-dependent methyltransferase